MPNYKNVKEVETDALGASSAVTFARDKILFDAENTRLNAKLARLERELMAAHQQLREHGISLPDIGAVSKQSLGESDADTDISAYTSIAEPEDSEPLDDNQISQVAKKFVNDVSAMANTVIHMLRLNSDSYKDEVGIVPDMLRGTWGGCEANSIVQMNAIMAAAVLYFTQLIDERVKARQAIEEASRAAAEQSLLHAEELEKLRAHLGHSKPKPDNTAAYKEEIGKLKRQLSEAIAQTEHAKEEMAKIIAKQNKQIESLRAELSIGKSKRELQDKLALVRSELEKANTKLQEQQDQITKLTEILAETEGKLTEARARSCQTLFKDLQDKLREFAFSGDSLGLS